MTAVIPPRLRPGRGPDLPQVLSLLAAAGLPTADLATVDLATAGDLKMWLLEVDGRTVGVIALERHGDEGLLRSLAVAPEFRERGLARELLGRLEREARELGLQRLTLLTETAAPFFEANGYARVDRATVSRSLQQSAEFRTLCPASAACLSKVIGAQPAT